MPVQPAYAPDPHFAALGREFADPVAAAAFPQTDLRFFNSRWAPRIGLEALTEAETLDLFGRFRGLPDQPPPLAMRYHGHQFRHYNPDLGDGRGFLYAQIRDAVDGRLLDLATKGSGQTPWSRSGDGRLTLKGGVREVLAAAMLEGLGVPTSKAFALIETGEALTRGDEPSPTRSAVLTRLSWSHVRFGTFQRHAFHDRADLTKILVDHVVETYYPKIADAPDRPVALLEAVVARCARLVGAWMAAGFVHGVLNTDNMNITGESFDYGPYRFLPFSDPGFTAAYFDRDGLYAFGRQPGAVFWNLQQLAACLALVSPDQPRLIEALNTFSDAYRAALAQAITCRMGVASAGAQADGALATATFTLLAEGGDALRWEPLFFDWFGGEASTARALQSPRAALYLSEAAMTFRKALSGRAPLRPAALSDAYLQRSEPEELLYDEIEALWAGIADRDDWSPFRAKLAGIDAMRRAYGLAGTAPD